MFELSDMYSCTRFLLLNRFQKVFLLWIFDLWFNVFPTNSTEIGWYIQYNVIIAKNTNSFYIICRDENDIVNADSIEVTDETVLLENLSPSTTYQISIIPLM